MHVRRGPNRKLAGDVYNSTGLDDVAAILSSHGA